LSDQKVYTSPFKVLDGKHIVFEINGGSDLIKWENKELTLKKLVLYREYIIDQPGSDQDGDKATILYTRSR